MDGRLSRLRDAKMGPFFPAPAGVGLLAMCDILALGVNVLLIFGTMAARKVSEATIAQMQDEVGADVDCLFSGAPGGAGFQAAALSRPAKHLSLNQ